MISQFIGTKSMNQIILKFDDYIQKALMSKNISYKIFKGNVLNEINEIKKSDGTPFKVFTPFWRTAEKYFIEKIPSKEKKIKKCLRKKKLFQILYKF